MSIEFVSLRCPSCAGKLEVYHDMETFACGYCGAETMVVRRGGSVSLKSLTEVLGNVQRGTDKTAAELALIRLLKELEEYKKQLSELNLQRDHKQQEVEKLDLKQIDVNPEDHRTEPVGWWSNAKKINKESLARATREGMKELESRRELARDELRIAIQRMDEGMDRISTTEQKILANRKLVEN